MKSCLKFSHWHTPPLTPDASACSTPAGSGRTSPSLSESSSASDGALARAPMQKRVSFHADDTLEEVFYVDEWDRSPAPVTPRLTYQDVLELKQLRLSLPRIASSARGSAAADDPSLQTYANTDANSVSPPASRLASAPSHTPARWKNRGTVSVDPVILPYLEAVPIRLLPLLDESASASPSSPSPPSNTLAATAPSMTPAPPPASSPSAPPHPAPSPSKPSSITTDHTPTTTATAPSTVPASSTVPAPSTAPASPPRRASFAFLPLLPVASTSPAPAPPAAQKTEPAPRKRRISMSFVPLLEQKEEAIAPPPAVLTAETQAVAPPQPPQKEERGDPDTRVAHATQAGAEAREERRADADVPAGAGGPTAEPPAAAAGAKSGGEGEGADYFAARAPSTAGQTPPLHTMYTEPLSPASGTPTGAGAEQKPPAALPPHVLQTVRLAALPSPALVPPSPFSLYPPAVAPAAAAAGVLGASGLGIMVEEAVGERREEGGRRDGGADAGGRIKGEEAAADLSERPVDAGVEVVRVDGDAR